MKRLFALCLTAGLIGVVGCGDGVKSHNESLKPIDPNTPPPKVATESGGGKKPVPGEGAGSIAK